jgi:hypothetical protein
VVLPTFRLRRDALIESDGRILPDLIYSRSQAACMLGITERQLMRWVHEGNGPPVIRLYPNAPPRFRGLHLLEALERSAGFVDGDGGAS